MIAVYLTRRICQRHQAPSHTRRVVADINSPHPPPLSCFATQINSDFNSPHSHFSFLLPTHNCFCCIVQGGWDNLDTTSKKDFGDDSLSRYMRYQLTTITLHSSLQGGWGNLDATSKKDFGDGSLSRHMLGNLAFAGGVGLLVAALSRRILSGIVLGGT
jgi:hypothetical protein